MGTVPRQDTESQSNANRVVSQRHCGQTQVGHRVSCQIHRAEESSSQHGSQGPCGGAGKGYGPDAPHTVASLSPRDQGRQGQAGSRRHPNALPSSSPALPNTVGFPHRGLGPSRKTGARRTGRKQPCDRLSLDTGTLPVLGNNRWREASTGWARHTPPRERGLGPPPTTQAPGDRRDRASQGRRGHPASIPQQP